MAKLASAQPKAPRTDRGRRTMRKLLDAAAAEFGERGFHDASISTITQRAGVALGSFYTYFESKDAIFRALVSDMSESVRRAARDAVADTMSPLEIEEAALHAFLRFASEHKEVYRIIDESEFVDPDSYRLHYETTAERIYQRLRIGVERGDYRPDVSEAHAWAIMGMNVFLGLRYSIWGKDKGDPGTLEVSRVANDFLARGIGAKP